MIEKSKSLEKLYYEYTHLPVGGKKVKCPYWANQATSLTFGPYGGKGLPEEVTKATEEAAKRERINLAKLTAEEIREFMENQRIGIDCSGFVFRLLDALDKEKGGEGIGNKVYGVKGYGVRKVNAYCLTNKRNSTEVKMVREVRLGDLLRMHGGKHIMLVLRIKEDRKGEIKEIIYAHSSCNSRITGVHSSFFKVKNLKGGLEEQEWVEKAKSGENFFQKYFYLNKGDGLRRLRVWKVKK